MLNRVYHNTQQQIINATFTAKKICRKVCKTINIYPTTASRSPILSGCGMFKWFMIRFCGEEKNLYDDIMRKVQFRPRQILTLNCFCVVWCFAGCANERTNFASTSCNRSNVSSARLICAVSPRARTRSFNTVTISSTFSLSQPQPGDIGPNAESAETQQKQFPRPTLPNSPYGCFATSLPQRLLYKHHTWILRKNWNRKRKES